MKDRNEVSSFLQDQYYFLILNTKYSVLELVLVVLNKSQMFVWLLLTSCF